jgi:hypothetical protein
MESVLTIVLALGVAGTAIRLLPVQENYVFETAAAPVQGKPLDELDGVTKAKIVTGLVEDTRVKTARPKPAAPRAEREIVQDTRILTATPTPDKPGEPLTNYTGKVPPPTNARASDDAVKADLNIKTPPPLMATPQAPNDPALTAAQYRQAQLSAQASNPSPPPQGSTAPK